MPVFIHLILQDICQQRVHTRRDSRVYLKNDRKGEEIPCSNYRDYILINKI
jgi:hypothetical protein